MSYQPQSPMSRELHATEKCIYCGADLFIPPNASSVQCVYCRTRMSVSRFTQEEKRLVETIDSLRAQLSGQYEILSEQYNALAERISSMQNEWRISLDGQLQELFRQGESYQMKGDFGSAIARYEVLLIKNPRSEAEVHWRILLCRYGIEYQKYPDGTVLPFMTDYGRAYVQRQLNRLRMHSVVSQTNDSLLLQDENYLLALQFAPDEEMRAFYQEEVLRLNAALLNCPMSRPVHQPSDPSANYSPSHQSSDVPSVSPSDLAEANHFYRQIKQMLQSNQGNGRFAIYDWVPDAERIWNKTRDERFGALLLGYYVAVLKNRPLAIECYEQLRRLNTPAAGKAISAPFIRTFLGL